MKSKSLTGRSERDDTTAHLMWIVATAEGAPIGMWLREYDPDGFNGIGRIVFTADVEQAQLFPSMRGVLTCWAQPSTKVPLRSDGKPNRPLTAYSVQPVTKREALKDSQS